MTPQARPDLRDTPGLAVKARRVRTADRDDVRGTPCLQLGSAGPMTDAIPPAGKYRVTARFKRHSEMREVTLHGKTGRDVYLHWKGARQ